jgi:hypothetical protein
MVTYVYGTIGIFVPEAPIFMYSVESGAKSEEWVAGTTQSVGYETNCTGRPLRIVISEGKTAASFAVSS